MTTGAQIIAKSLHNLGVEVVFGLVGIPVIEVADALQELGIKFIAFRNEQAASYAASVYGFLTNTPGVLLVVGGPGIVHAMAGIFNSQSNHWPLLVLAGSVESNVRYQGGFQELDQVNLVQSFVKFSAKPANVLQVPRIISKSFRISLYGKPGCTYVDLPGDLIQCQLSNNELKNLQSSNQLQPNQQLALSIPKSIASQQNISNAITAIKNAKFPLVIIGKGAAYSGASEELTGFVQKFQIPFIPTPMGKGVVSDYDKLNLSSARSLALKSADVVILMGARLNWIMHFGGSGAKFYPDVKYINVNQSAEEIGENYMNSDDVNLGLVGDVKLVTRQLLEHEQLQNYQYGLSKIPHSILDKVDANNKSLEAKESTIKNGQLNYNVIYKNIREFLTKGKLLSDTTIVSEGANTMDISRVSFPMVRPKQRLDAGTNSTMGVGLGYAIAAKVAEPDKHILAIEGDSAFGFSAIEIETAVRYDLGMIIVVMNNSGIYHGIAEDSKDEHVKKPIELSQDTRYDLLAQSLGADGYLVRDLSSLENALQKSFQKAFKLNKCSVINVIIEPGEQKKVSFKWQNQPKPESDSKL